MRTLFIFLIFLTTCSDVIANTDDDVRAIVHKWNDLHNTNNTQGFLSLYSPTVLFYGKTYTSQKCVEIKTRLLAEGFKQEIVSPIEVTYYSSGIIKCAFTKRTWIQNKSKEHFSYLLIKLISGNYLITGESDLLSDQNRNVQLQLGTEITKGNGNSSILIIIIISAILLMAVAFAWKRMKQTKTTTRLQQDSLVNNSIPIKQEQNEYKDLTAETNLAILNKIKEAVREEFKNLNPAETIEKQKGDAFENFIVKKFDHKAFRLAEWRGDKYHEGRYAQSNHLPDMQFEFIHPFAKKASFAVECKYRSKYTDNSIELAKEYQLKNYREYARSNRLPVFIVLGIGGEASVPEELFIIPLKDLHTNYISKFELVKYKKRKTDGTFFYNSNTMELG